VIIINRIEIIGKVINISNEIIDRKNNRYYFIKLKQNRTLEDDVKSSIFFIVKVTYDLFKKYKDMIIVDKYIYIDGYLNSYFKDGLLISYIYPMNIKDYSDYKSEKIITYNSDGVMLWHGKRCVKVECSSEEKEELEDLIRKISDDK